MPSTKIPRAAPRLASFVRLVGLAGTVTLVAQACGGAGVDDVPGPVEGDAAATDTGGSDGTVSPADGSGGGDGDVPDATTNDATLPDGGDAGSSDGGGDSAGPLDGGSDAVPPRDAGRDGAVVTDAAACPPAPSGTNRHVYVDSAANPAVANGSEVCPFRSISDAVTYTTSPGAGQTLTIHVWGEASGTEYLEPSGVTLPPRTTLTSLWGGAPADPRVVIVRAISATAQGSVVVVPSASVLEGVTVDPSASSAQHGIVTTAASVSASTPPVVRNVIVAKATQWGIWVQNRATLGPALVARENGTGVRVEGAVTLVGPGTHVDKNSGNGVEVAGVAGGNVTITDATVSENGNHGVSLSPAGSCTFTKLTASKNVGLGLDARGGVTLSVTVADSAFDDNGWSGALVGPVGLSSTGPDLAFTNVSASRNAVDGLRLKTHQTVPLTKIVASGNGLSPGAELGGAGLLLEGTGSYVVREGRFLGNTVGVLAAVQTLLLGKVNFGAGGDLGANVFARSVAGNNTKAGVCYLASPKTGLVPALGNAWSSCAPTQTAIAKTTGLPSECYAPASYSDITYQPGGNGASYDDPLATGSTSPSCTVGN